MAHVNHKNKLQTLPDGQFTTWFVTVSTVLFVTLLEISSTSSLHKFFFATVAVGLGGVGYVRFNSALFDFQIGESSDESECSGK